MKRHLKQLTSTALLVLTIGYATAEAQQLQQWKHYSNSATPNCMIPDGKYLWIGSNSGLVKFDRTNGSFEVFHSSNSALPMNAIVALAKDKDGGLWVGMRGAGVARLSEGKWTSFTPRDHNLGNGVIWTIAVDSSGTVWLGGDGGLQRFTNGTFQTFTPSNSPLARKTIYRLAADRTGGLWVAAEGSSTTDETRASILRYDGTNWELHNDSTDTNFPNSNTFGIYPAKNGDVWFGFEGRVGILRDREWAIHNVSGGSLGNYVQGIGEDATGGIYIASGLSVAKFNGAGWNELPKAPYHGGTGVLQDGHALWFAGPDHGGIAKLDAGIWTVFDSISNSGIVSNHANAMTIDSRGTYWFGGSVGRELTSFDGKEWKVLRVLDSANDGVSALAADSSGNLWIGLGMNGFAKWDGAELTRFDRSNSPLISNRFTTIAYDHTRGGIWLGGRYDQLSDSAVKGAMTWFDGTNFRNFHKLNSNIPHTEINKIAIAPNGDLWLAFPYVGVGRWNGVDTVWDSFRQDNTDFPDQTAEDLAIAKDGSVWVATNSGAAHYADGYWNVYSKSNSRIGTNSLTGVAIDTSGSVWFSSFSTEDGGLTKYDGIEWKHYGIFNSPVGSMLIKTMMADHRGSVFAGTYDAGVVVFNEDGFGEQAAVSEVPQAAPYSVFPNPTREEITVRMSNTAVASLSIVDVLGRPHLSLQDLQGAEVVIDVRSLPAGSYLVVIEQGVETRTSRMVKH